MKQPKYCDNRYPFGYTRAAATDVRKTFRRERERLKQEAEAAAKEEAERAEKVRKIAGRK